MSQYVNPIEHLIHSTVRIVCEDAKGKASFGTGFIFYFCEIDGQSVPCIVTNKHVVSGGSRGIFHLTLKGEDQEPKLGEHEEVVLEDLQRYCILHPDPKIDLVAIPIGPILNNAEEDGKNYYYVPLGKAAIGNDELLESLPSMEEIVMIGYPNGIWDAKHNLPIIRRGITATHPKLHLNGKPEFLIDAACFPGSSGSPVFLANIGSYTDASGAFRPGTRISLLGILYAGPQHTAEGEVIVVEVPTDTKTISVGTIPNNLGLVIHARELNVLEEAVAEGIKQPKRIPRNSLCPCGSGDKYKNCCGKMT
ncbi:MAG: trypsin-like peptidase domain-containing protein [Pseudomonadota bacterium]